MLSNVFEFLSTDHDLRTGNKFVQLVKNLEEVPDSRKHKGDYAVQIKWDGVFCMAAVFNGKVSFFGRTGKQLKNLDYLKNEFPETTSGIYIGEVFTHNMSLEQLSGCIQPNRVAPLSEEEDAKFKDGLVLHIHDYLTVREFLDGESDDGYLIRYHKATELHQRFFLPTDSIRFKMCNFNFMTIEEAEEYSKECIIEGHEGIVIKHLDAPWKAGHKGWHAMKIVRGVDYDLLCIGYEEGTGKYTGKVANLLFQWKDGKIVKCMLGKGWTHDDAEIMFEACETGSDLDPCGKIFQVYALQESSKGVLRLPKVGEKRWDKNGPDV